MIQQTSKESRLVVQEVNDPGTIARSQAQNQRAQRNSDWLQQHWANILSQARGGFVAVAGQEAFIADTAE